MTFGGLDVDAMTELVRIAGDDDIRAQAAALGPALHETTRGNPFFAREVVRHWNSGATGVPPAVVDAVRALLLVVPPAARPVVTVAALVGADFDVWSLRQLTELDDETILDALEQSSAAGLIVEAPDTPDRWSFSHALVRDALMAELSAGRRRAAP